MSCADGGCEAVSLQTIAERLNRPHPTLKARHHNHNGKYKTSFPIPAFPDPTGDRWCWTHQTELTDWTKK